MATRKTAADKSSEALTVKTSKITAVKGQKKAAKGKKAEGAATDTSVLNKANVNPLEKVMEIKAHNEEVKAAKALKKASKKSVKTLNSADVNKTAVLEEEKGVKTLADTKKRRNTIKSAQDTAARKSAEVRAEEIENSEHSCCLCKSFCNGAFGAWADAYKSIFNFRGRTSRYEFWSFQLINCFVLIAFIVSFAILMAPVINTNYYAVLGGGILLFFYAVQTLVNLSLSVRRLHDTGNTAWKGFYRPLVCAGVSGFILSLISDYYLPDDNELNALSFVIVLGFLVWLPFSLYYIAKMFIAVSFVEEDSNVLLSGEPRYADVEHKKRAMKYAAIYFVIWILLSVFSVVFTQMYITAMAHYNAGMYY